MNNSSEGQTLIQRLAARVRSFDTSHLSAQAIALSRTAIIDTVGVTLAELIIPPQYRAAR